MASRIEQSCIDKGLKMTGQRRIIARVLSDAEDHPDVEEVYRRSSKIDARISLATVYRTLRIFEDSEIIQSHDFGGGRARYEATEDDEHHDHLINVDTGEVIEFYDDELEALQEKIAKRLGFRLVDHRFELYGLPIKPSDKDS
ncbi:MAG: transcriptional repressor [Rhodospirillaceae bacterium]|nr:transcriptional repressor [Rhodospirillaceae bacterium]|tara:strand:- start:4473 stop:4901 length:429 start_codon:yes stop_codon:yes gene_type:complete